MNTYLVLSAAHDLLARRATVFTTRALARDAKGKKVAPDSPYAVRWDAIGAVLHVARRSRIPASGPVFDAIELLDQAAQDQGYLSAYRCSDTLGYSGAITMFRRALAGLERPPTRASKERSTA